MPCAATIAECEDDVSIVTERYVFWIRVGDELMRVVDMDPPQLNDMAWQGKNSGLHNSYYGPNQNWDANYTNGGTGLLTKVFKWDPSTYNPIRAFREGQNARIRNQIPLATLLEPRPQNKLMEPRTSSNV